MTIYLLGDWQQAMGFMNGLGVLQDILNWNNLKWWLNAFLVVAWFWLVFEGVTKKKTANTFWIILLPVYVSMVQLTVDASLPTPAAASSLESSIDQARARLTSADSALAAADEELGRPNIVSARERVIAAQSDLQRLQALDSAGGAVTVKVPVGFALPFQIVNTFFLGLWEVVDAADWHNVKLKDRAMQSAIAQHLAEVPNLSPVEEQVALQLSQCLIEKQKYVEQSSRIAEYVAKGLDPDSSRSPARTGEALVDAWAEMLLPSREAVKVSCNNMSKNLFSAVDASISEADIKDFAGGYILPLIGEVGAPDRADKIAFLAGQIGTTADALEGKSDEEIAKMYLRFKKFAAVTESLTKNLEKLGSGVAGSGLNNAGGFAAAAGGWMSEWTGSFMLAVKPITLQILTFLYFLLPISFVFTLFACLVPGNFKRAWQGFLSGVVMLFALQFSVLLVTKFIASMHQTEVGMQADKKGMVDGSLQVLSAGWDGLTGGAEVGDVAAAGGVAGKAGSNAAIRSVGKQVISKLIAVSPKYSAPTLVVSAVALGGIRISDGLEKLGKENAEFAKLMIEDGGLNPVLEGLAGGVVKQQQRKMQDAKNRLDLLEALFLIGGWVLSGALVYGSWRAVGSINGGEAARTSGGLFSTALSRGTGTPGRGGKK